MYTVYVPDLGEVWLDLDSLVLLGHIFHIIGRDDSRSRIEFVIDKLSCLEDYYNDYGYCHILSYTKDGVMTPCNLYCSLS